MCVLFWGAHKSLAPTARTLLGGLGQATLSFFAVATPLFVFFRECPKFCDLAKQRRKILGGFLRLEKTIFSLYFFWRCVVFFVFFSSAAITRLHLMRWLGEAPRGTRRERARAHAARSKGANTDGAPRPAAAEGDRARAADCATQGREP